MLYSSGVFDLTSPVTITMPDAGARFQSLRAINQNHYIVQNTYDAASYTFTQGSVGTRYLHMAKRTLSDPENPEDMARALQDQVAWTMDDPDGWSFPTGTPNSGTACSARSCRWRPMSPTAQRCSARARRSTRCGI